MRSATRICAGNDNRFLELGKGLHIFYQLRELRDHAEADGAQSSWGLEKITNELTVLEERIAQLKGQELLLRATFGESNHKLQESAR